MNQTYLDKYAKDIKRLKTQTAKYKRLMRLIEEIEADLQATFTIEAYEEIFHIAVFPRLRLKHLALWEKEYQQ